MAPAETEPLPAGSPRPSGSTVISSLRISSGGSGRPRLGCCASHTTGSKQSTAAGNSNAHLNAGPNVGLKISLSIDNLTIPDRNAVLNIDILHRPIRFHTPALNAVEVIRLARRVLRDPRRSARLHIAFFIRGPAHEHRWPPVPLPCQPEPRERLGQNGIAKSGRRPALSAIRGNFYFGNPARPRPCQARHFVKSRTFHRESERRLDDCRFHALHQHVLPRFSVRHQLP